MTPPELTAVQVDRLLQQAKLTAEAYERLLIAQATDVPNAELHRVTADYNADLSHFTQLREHRGLLPGDRIRIVVDGPFKDEEGVVREWAEWYGVFFVDWPDGSLCRHHCTPRATEVELVEAGE